MLSRPLKRECATVHTSDQMDNWICSELLCDFFVESISVQTHHLYHLIYLNTLNVFKGFSNCQKILYFCFSLRCIGFFVQKKSKHLNISVNFDHHYYLQQLYLVITLTMDHGLPLLPIIFLRIKSLLRSLLCISNYCCRFHYFTSLRFLVSVCNGYC